MLVSSNVGTVMEVHFLGRLIQKQGPSKFARIAQMSMPLGVAVISSAPNVKVLKISLFFLGLGH